MTLPRHTVSSRALCPGAIPQPAPALVDGWMPGTSPGMTGMQKLNGVSLEGSVG